MPAVGRRPKRPIARPRSRGGPPGGPRASPGSPDSPRIWQAGSPSHAAAPAWLPAPARPTQPSEPILLPKLRIRLADFPYLHCSRGCSPWRPAAVMGMTRGESPNTSPGFSRTSRSAPDAAVDAALYGAADPLSGRTDSRDFW